MLRTRRALPDDAPAIRAVHADAVRTRCRSHYRAEEIETWVAETQVGHDLDCRDVFVAVAGDRIVGFGEVDGAAIRAVYVASGEDSRGAGAMLLRTLEDTARLRGHRELVLDASLNAVPFYAAAGWCRLGPGRRRLASGEGIACVRMAKRVPPPRLVVRLEEGSHVPAIRALHCAAFGREAEGLLVDRLRGASALMLSLVAELDGKVVGHVGFSPVTLEGLTGVLGLGPLAVVPSCQGNGIGARLVEEGLVGVREGGAPAVVVFGDPAYYPRFGFVPASRFGVCFDHRALEGAFFVAELVPNALGRAESGTVVRYHSAFCCV